MRIGELARRSSLSRDTLRFYERNGLITSEPGTSDTNSYRDYPEENLLTLEIIGQAKAAGLSLSDLIIFMSQLAAQDSSDFDGELFLADKIAEVEARITQSSAFLETLKTTLVALSAASQKP